MHPIRVAEILSAYGYSDDVVVAGFLHDLVEDVGVTFDEIEERFCPEVAELVAAGSEPDKTFEWRVRKQHTVDGVGKLTADERGLVAADKLDNVRAIGRDLALNGDSVWSRFNRPKQDQSWYYRAISQALLASDPANPLFAELAREVAVVFAGIEASREPGPARAASGSEVIVLGIDTASKNWKDVGSALLTFDRGSGACVDLVHNAITWPTRSELTAATLTAAVDEFARENGVVCVSFDGPQGWRDPKAGDRPGVGRACEYATKTQGKTGEFGHTYPTTQMAWNRLSIAVFDRLLAKPDVQLVNDPSALPLTPLGQGSWVLESFATSLWRSSGLEPPPGKDRFRKDRGLSVDTYASALARRWQLPEMLGIGHDDLQGVVAGLAAAAVMGFATPIPRGVAATDIAPSDGIPAHRVEGFIWDAAPFGD